MVLQSIGINHSNAVHLSWPRCFADVVAQFCMLLLQFLTFHSIILYFLLKTYESLKFKSKRNVIKCT